MRHSSDTKGMLLAKLTGVEFEPVVPVFDDGCAVVCSCVVTPGMIWLVPMQLSTEGIRG